MGQKILFIAATHGNEKIGVKVMKQLEENGFKPNWIIGNKKAFKQNKRFIDVDLNRSAPGSPKAKEYEKRRAWEILKLASKFKYVIDIHGTVSGSGIFTIITNPKIENLIFAASLPIKNIVIWVAKKSEVMNPLSEYFPRGLEIECGPKNSKKIRTNLKKIIINILKNNRDINNANKKNIFQVYGRIDGDWDYKLKDFKETVINDEKFYPLLSNQYRNIVCYKMKKVDFIDLFAY